MELAYWILIPVWLLIIVLVFYIRRKINNKHKPVQVIIANPQRITNLPSYTKLLRRYKIILSVATILTSLLLATAITLTARPSGFDSSTQKDRTRDIMLCLDVSGSMVGIDAKLFEIFDDLIKDLKGERIGLTVFDSSPAMLVPLTDDYTVLEDYIKLGERSFKKLAETEDLGKLNKEEYADYNTLVGATHNGEDSSMIGTGFASCVNHMGDNTNTRTRSIILATDNGASEQDIITLSEAAAVAKEANVRVYIISPGLENTEYGLAAEVQEMEVAAESTGGSVYTTADLKIEQIVKNITKQEAKSTDKIALSVQRDSPEIFLYLSWVFLALIIFIGWRYKL